MNKYYINRFISRDIDIHELIRDSSYYRPPNLTLNETSDMLEIKIIIPDEEEFNKVDNG